MISQKLKSTNHKLFLIFFFAIVSLHLQAQLQANFTVDNASGCSPLSVKFTNTTTGKSAYTTWTWNLGNGNSSALFEPGATYRTEQKYTITLTAKDGANTSVKSIDIFVYKKPTLDFSVSPASGCIPLLVSFTASATAGDGNIAQYHWDYGDGKTEQGVGFQKTSHTYTDPQTPPITLTVTNSYGCYSTLSKTNLIEVYDGVKASFTPSTLTVCNAGDNVTFTNTSIGTGTLTYLWEFGDGKTSTDQSPNHSFASSGIFGVKLTTKNKNGCSATTTPTSINVANFTANFDVPPLLCQNTNIAFTNKGTIPFDKAEWKVDNNAYSYTNNGNFSQNFYLPGEHSLKLVNYYGDCTATITKIFTITKMPHTPDFIADVQGACGVPVTVKFKDTSSEAAKWEWKLDYSSNNTFATTQNAAYNFTIGSASNVYLKVTNKEGCSNNANKYVYYGQPNIQILVKNSNGSSYNDYNYGKCGDVIVNLLATPDSLVKDMLWDFGDGSPTSNQRNPTHTYSKNGNYTITLNYTTINGCKGTARYSVIKVIEMPVFDISVNGSNIICGNTPTNFSVTPAPYGWYYNWNFGDYDNGYFNYGSSTITQRFDYDTTYSVRVIATNNGCYDTVFKKDFVKVLPPFPKIGAVINTCNDKRGVVTFIDQTYKAQKWNWNFGDSSVPEEYTVYRDSIQHTYTKTGVYKVVLTTTYGSCTVKDSATAYVVLKQNPILSSTQTDACGSDVVNVKIDGFETNTNTDYSNFYSISQLQYGDLTTADAYLSNIYWQPEAPIAIRNLDPGKNDLRIITTSNYFGCYDTTNFIPIKIHGPQAIFKKDNHSGCFKDLVNFTDLSKSFENRAIVKWEWNFGDGSTKILTTNSSTNHLYNRPGSYYVSLKITDIDGCTNETNLYSHYISVSGPKADFSVYSSIAYNSYSIPPNTQVSFNNTSILYDYYYSSLKWIFSDGSTSTNTTPLFTFKDEGAYDVKLITYNSLTGCTDTVKKTITVRKVNSVFSHKLSYINNNNCPPVLVSFTSLSTNAEKVSWSFGDGAIASNQKNVSHTYTKPGIYRVVHYSYDIFNNVDITEDFIEVKGPYALLKADKISACKTLDVRLDADVKYADSYTWDFGDGTLVPTTDVYALHTYQTPGIYTPALILKDLGGCTATSELPDKVVVDSLQINFITPAAICNTALVTFTPQVSSLSKSLLQTTLKYRWIIKEVNTSDTIYTEIATHTFSKIGTHHVSLTVTSPYGCEEELTKTVTVKAGIKAAIDGVDKICEDEWSIFTGSATPSIGILSWKWNFNNGVTADIQNPSAQIFNTAGHKIIELIADNGNCPDTARHILQVIEHPIVNITPATPFVCKDKSTQLTASGGVDYTWTSSGNILTNTDSIATVNPSSDSYYFVTVKNEAGCSTTDSVLVKIIYPITVVAKTPIFSCEGDPVQLQASGADTYKWLPADSLNNAAISNPILTTKTKTTLTVIGYDTFNCFTDTAWVDINISKLPTVNAGTDQQITAGTTTTLNAVVGSGAVSWKWSPVDYLSCVDCLTPVSKPKNSITYTVTATNADGCKATDEVRIQLICKSGLIYIPSAFSPNQDKVNDKFSIHGDGIKSIHHFIIYDRWGKIIFNRSGINIGDVNSSWDGTLNGQSLPTGNYIYSIQIECEAGDIFDYKGSVLLIR